MRSFSGYDARALQKHICGPKFRGVKMIPSGIHMLSFASPGKQDMVFTSSMFCFLSKGAVRVLHGVRNQGPMTAALKIETMRDLSGLV